MNLEIVSTDDLNEFKQVVTDCVNMLTEKLSKPVLIAAVSAVIRIDAEIGNRQNAALKKMDEAVLALAKECSSKPASQ